MRNRSLLVASMGLVLIVALTIYSHVKLPLIDAYPGFGDAFVRVVQAKQGLVPKFGQWLPFHIWLIEQGLYKYDAIYFTPRLQALIIAGLLFGVFCFYSLTITKRRLPVLVGAYLFFLIRLSVVQLRCH